MKLETKHSKWKHINHLPVPDTTGDATVCNWLVWLVDEGAEVEAGGMLVVSTDDSFEFEVSFMTSKVGQDTDGDCGG